MSAALSASSESPQPALKRMSYLRKLATGRLCNGHCPPGHCPLQQCSQHASAAEPPSSSSSSSSSDSSTSPSSSDAAPPLTGSSSLSEVLAAGLSYAEFITRVYEFHPDWELIRRHVQSVGHSAQLLESDPHDLSHSYQLALQQHRGGGENRRGDTDGSDTEPGWRRSSGVRRQQDAEATDSDVDIEAQAAHLAASSSFSPASSPSSSHSAFEAPAAKQEEKSQSPPPAQLEEESGGDAPRPRVDSAAAADEAMPAEGERRPLPDALYPWLPASLHHGLQRRGTRLNGWGCFATLLGALNDSSLPVQQEESQLVARDLLRRVTWWDAATLRSILEIVPLELRDSATYDLFDLSAEQPLNAIHSQLQQYVQRYVDGRIMSSGLEMLRLCQAASLSSSAVTIYVMQLQPAVTIIRLPSFIAASSAVCLLQPGLLSQIFQVVLQPADGAEGSADVVRFPLSHQLVVEAERWLLQQQQQRPARTDEEERRREGSRPPVEEEKRPQPEQPRRELASLNSSQQQRGGSDDEEEEEDDDDDDDESCQDTSRVAQQAGRASSGAASPHSASPSWADEKLCPHDCGCDEEDGCRLQLPQSRLTHHLRNLRKHSRCTVHCALWCEYDITGWEGWLHERERWRQAGGQGSGPAVPDGQGKESYCTVHKMWKVDGRRNPVRKRRRSTR